jgi:hypothetical protein
MMPQQFELVENEQQRIRVVGRIDAVELTAIGPARATRIAVPVMGAMRRSNHASVRPMAARSACAEADPDAMIAAIWA